MRTRVHFLVPVTVYHKDENALKAAVESFIKHPAHECRSNAGFSYRTGKPARANKTKRAAKPHAALGQSKESK